MQAIRCIVTDLDNTLLSSEKRISDDTASTLNRCKERGMLLVYATARPERAVRRFLHAVTPDYIIANNGATIARGTARLYNRRIAPDVAASLLTALRDERKVSLLTVEVGHCLYTNYDGPPWEEDWNIIYHDFQAMPEGDVIKISTECKQVQIVRGILTNYPELHLYENSGEAWQQVMHSDATKMNAIQFIAQRESIALSQIVAFGDDYNDVEMIARCGVGVAVENAIDQAKCAADAVCDSNDRDGVARWLAANILC